jgi:hypothetical protein
MKTRLVVVTTGAALLLAAGLGSAAWAGHNTFNGSLTAIRGAGSGTIAGAATAEDKGSLTVQGQVSVHNTTPNVTFTIQRALDVVPDGICDTSGGFLELGTFPTSAGGAGAGHFERHAPLPSGVAFDVLFQVVGTDGTLFESECFTVTAK